MKEGRRRGGIGSSGPERDKKEEKRSERMGRGRERETKRKKATERQGNRTKICCPPAAAATNPIVPSAHNFLISLVSIESRLSSFCMSE